MRRAAIPVAAPQPRVATPSVSGGDLALFALPQDTTGRMVVVLPLLLAADLLAPWIVLGDARVSPVRAGLLVLLAALPFALIALMAVYLPLRQRPILAAIPLVVSALALGGGLILLLLVGPFGGRIMSVISAGTLVRLNVFIVTGTQTPIPGPLPLAPDIGLYAFIVGGVALVIANYRRLEALIASQYTVSAPATSSAVTSASGEQESGVTPNQAEAVAPTPSARMPATPLPGTPGWNEAPELPVIVRNGPPIRGLRRVDPRS
jgi:hypothetical protein